jgi:tetratricopeptide (TPR) repeat protein
MKLYVFYFLILLIPASCKTQKTYLKQYDPKAIKLNNSAMKIAYNISTCNPDSINKSIDLLEKAIKIDSSYYTAYVNESGMFCRLKKYSSAINVLTRGEANCPGEIMIVTMKGFLYEKTNNVDSAGKMYIKAIASYDSLLNKDPSNISLKLNRLFLLLFTDNAKEAKIEFEKIKKENPNNSLVKSMNDLIYSFDKKLYVNTLFSDCVD